MQVAAPAAHRLAITLVCKRWLRVYFSQSPELWRSSIIAYNGQGSDAKQQEEWLAAKRQHLRKTAASVEKICLQRVDGIDALADLLSCLSPAVLSKVAVTSHGSMAAGDMRALLRFPRLQVCSLQLRGVAVTLPANASWVLGQLRCLQGRSPPLQAASLKTCRQRWPPSPSSLPSCCTAVRRCRMSNPCWH
jgi:hypothetical protein